MKMRTILYGLGLAVIAVSVQAVVFAAATQPVPEIDGGTLVSGLGIAAGGLMVLRARYGRN